MTYSVFFSVLSSFIFQPAILNSTSAPSTCSFPNLPCLSQNSVLCTWNSSRFYSSFSVQFKDPGPSLTLPPHHCWVPLLTSIFNCLQNTPLEYPTDFSDSICLKLKIITPKPAYSPLGPYVSKRHYPLSFLLLCWNPKHHTWLITSSFPPGPAKSIHEFLFSSSSDLYPYCLYLGRPPTYLIWITETMSYLLSYASSLNSPCNPCSSMLLEYICVNTILNIPLL